MKCDCNGMDLNELPSFENPNQIVSMDLSNNNLSNVTRWHLGEFTALRFMDISGNPIKEIGSKAFLNSSQMIELRLSANSLRYNSLRGMRSLRKLEIDGNGKLQEIPSQVMSHLQALEDLSITNTAITSLPPSFMDSYQHLKIINMKNNHLNSIDVGAFNNTPELLELHLAHNKIKTIHHSIVKHTSKLKVFDISHNELSTIDNDFLGSINDLNTLDLSFNKLASVSIKTNMLNLDLSSNAFTDTNNIKVSNKSWIQYLNLANNSLSRVTKFYTIDKNSVPSIYAEKQQKVDISYNEVQQIDADSFSSFYQIKKLDLEGNALTNIDNLRLPSFMRRLHLAKNRFTAIPQIVKNFKQMRWLDLSSNQLHNITEGVFTHFEDFRYFNVSHNRLDHFPEDFLTNSTITETLDMSGNSLACTCALKIGLARISESATILGKCQSAEGPQSMSTIKPTLMLSGMGLISNECNFCSLNPCQHGGICLNKTDEKTVCQCKPGFSGSACENVLPSTTTTPSSSSSNETGTPTTTEIDDTSNNSTGNNNTDNNNTDNNNTDNNNTDNNNTDNNNTDNNNTDNNNTDNNNTDNNTDNNNIDNNDTTTTTPTKTTKPKTSITPTLSTTTTTLSTTTTTKSMTTTTTTIKTTKPTTTTPYDKMLTTDYRIHTSPTQPSPITTKKSTDNPEKKSEKSQIGGDEKSVQNKLKTSIVFNVILAGMFMAVVIMLALLYRKYRIVYKLNQYHTKKDTIQLENSTTVNSV